MSQNLNKHKHMLTDDALLAFKGRALAAGWVEYEDVIYHQRLGPVYKKKILMCNNIEQLEIKILTMEVYTEVSANPSPSHEYLWNLKVLNRLYIDHNRDEIGYNCFGTIELLMADVENHMELTPASPMEDSR